jgi:hypothetical protein
LGARKKKLSQESRHSNGLFLGFNKTSYLESVGTLSWGSERYEVAALDAAFSF